MAVSYLACMVMVASFYHLPPRVLPSIQAVEGGANGILHHNANGTDDYGVMQVNTIWIAPLARYSGLPPVEVARRLALVPCFNIAAAGAILRSYLAETNDDLLAAIGDYHSHTPAYNHVYQAQVIGAAERLFGFTAARRPAPAPR